MTLPPRNNPHIVFLFSDTGGGHRSAAEAIIEALELEFPGQITSEMVDIFKDYAPAPLNHAPKLYPPISRMPDMWALGYRLSDGRRRTHTFSNIIWPYIRRHARKLVEEKAADLYVSVHPLANTPFIRALAKNPQPLMTIVTDMVSVHAFWYDPRAKLVVVATPEARERGIAYGVPPEKIEVVGLPVAERFCHPPSNVKEIRERLGWETDLPVILLVGGGEGMGPMEKIARSINEAELPAALTIVCGRNTGLRNRLEGMDWRIPVKIVGFTRDMPDYMAAADILVTKAGPGTISEAFIAGLPIIIYSRMPGQEDGNVFYVVNQKAGIWAPHPERVVAALRDWLEHPEKRAEAKTACQRLAKPGASRQIARVIAQQVGIDR